MQHINLETTDLMTAREAWQELGISRATFYRRVAAGALHPVTLAGKTFYLRDEIEAARANSQQKPAFCSENSVPPDQRPARRPAASRPGSRTIPDGMTS